jgi:uncharacterized protein (TIGR03067 family)
MLRVFGRLLAAATLFVCLPLTAASPAPNDAPGALPAAAPATFVVQPGTPAESQLAQLKTGKWKTVGAQMGGQTMPAQVVSQIMPGEMQFGEGKIVVTLAGKQAGEVPYTVDESVSPARMTVDGALVANAPPAKRAKSTVIFRIEGDKLEICGGKDPANPPAEFSATKENGQSLITYERVK